MGNIGYSLNSLLLTFYYRCISMKMLAANRKVCTHLIYL